MESKTMLTLIEYEEGFNAAALGLPLDPDASAMWQQGWHDGKACKEGDT